MPAPTYALAIDLDRDELFASSETITGDVISPSGRSGEVLFESARGHDIARVLSQPRAGAGRFTLNNKDGLYSIGTSLAAGEQVRVRATYSGTTYDLARGLLQEPKQSPIGTARAFVECPFIGTLSRLANMKISTALYANIATGTAIGYLLDAIGWPKNAQPYVTGLSPAGQWGLGAASGTEADLSGNGNTGTVTIGAGARDYAALDDTGDGCIDFDGANTLVNVADAASIQNIFDGGGAIAALINLDTDGEGAVGRIIDKSAWYLNVQNSAGGFVRLNFRVGFSGTQGIWQSAVTVPLATTMLVAVVYNADNVANDPTIYTYNVATGTFATLTVGAGLTETSTPVGTRTTDVGSALIIGNNAGATATADGRIDEVVVISAAAGLTAAQVKAIGARSSDAPRDLDTGRSTLSYWWLDDEDAMAALVALKATEGPGAAIYEDGTGAIVFRDRQKRLTASRSTVSQTTFRTAAGATEPLASLPFAYDPGTRDVVNDVTVEVKSRTVQAIQTVWTLGSTITLAAGETRKYLARGGQTTDITTGQYIGPFTGAVAPTSGAGDYTVTAGSLVSSPTLDRTSGASVTLTVGPAGASGATITGMRLRAQPVTVSATTPVRSTIDASTSQTAFGVRTFPLPIRQEIAINDAQDLCNAIVGFQQNGRSTVLFTVRGIHGAARLTAALAREVSDRVTVIHAASGLNADFYIESIAHRVIAPASHVTTFAGENAPADSYAVWGTSTWGTGRWGY